MVKIHYKIYIQAFVAFIYADNKLAEREIRKQSYLKLSFK